MSLYHILRLSLLISLFFISSCATSPTGRNQLLLYSAQQLDQMGTQAFSAMKQDLKVSNRPVENDYVNCVARHIVRQVPSSVYAGEWEVVVFADPQVNAFALPGGKIGVYTGLLDVAQNQHQLAAVIGHEVGHVIAEHGNERMSQSALIETGKKVAEQALQLNQVSANKEIMSAIGLGLQVGVQLPFSRNHESEADIIGLDLMAKSGFDPRESVQLWQNMAANSQGKQPPEFLSTHPAPQNRAAELKRNMSAALASYAKAAQKPQCFE